MRIRFHRIRGSFSVLAALLLAAPLAAQEIRTASEESGFERHTTHAEMMDYLVKLRATSQDMLLSEYGETREGRVLPYVILSRPLVTQPWEAMLLGRPIIALNANVHGGERTLRESLLVLLRQLATRGTPENAWLDQVVVIAAPQINPDGFHTGNNGSRGNAWGIDLNRDYVKLEHPEIANYVGNVINRWHPHLFVDGHNGCSQPYNVCYQGPSHASPDQRITELADFQIFPLMDRRMQENGFKSWYYTGGNATRWNTGGFQARIGRNYGGFVNAVGILFESPGGQTLETGVRSGMVAFKSILEYGVTNSARLMEVVNRARAETVALGNAAEGEVVVQMRYGPEDRTVQYEIMQGQGDERRAVAVTSDSLMKKPVPTLTRRRPYAYVLPRDAVDAVAMLKRHNILVERLEEPIELNVDAYTIADIRYQSQYNHAATVNVTVGEVTPITRTFPRGTYIVRTGQVLGRLVSHMLEAETDDNVLYWNTMDAWLPRPSQIAAAQDPDDDPDEPPTGRGGRGGRGGGGGRGGRGGGGPPLVPIFKLMTPMALPASIVQ